MKKLSWLLVLAMVVSLFAMTASAEGDYTQAPMLDAAVEAGELPPVEERLPETPRIVKEILDEYLDYESGNYGGTLRLITSVVNWDADGFVGMDENFLTMESANSDVRNVPTGGIGISWNFGIEQMFYENPDQH